MPLTAIRFGQAQIQKGKPVQCLKRVGPSVCKNLTGQVFVPHRNPSKATLIYRDSDGPETHLVPGHWYNTKGKLVRSHSYASIILNQGLEHYFTDIDSWKPKKSLTNLVKWVIDGINCIFFSKYRSK